MSCITTPPVQDALASLYPSALTVHESKISQTLRSLLFCSGPSVLMVLNYTMGPKTTLAKGHADRWHRVRVLALHLCLCPWVHYSWPALTQHPPCHPAHTHRSRRIFFLALASRYRRSPSWGGSRGRCGGDRSAASPALAMPLSCNPAVELGSSLENFSQVGKQQGIRDSFSILQSLRRPLSSLDFSCLLCKDTPSGPTSRALAMHHPPFLNSHHAEHHPMPITTLGGRN